MNILQQNQKIQFYQTNQKILELFVYYCSFGDKDNYCYLKIQNYWRMLTDLQIFSPQNESKINQNLKSKLEIVFLKGKTKISYLSFEQFLGKIEQIANIKYNFGNIEESIEKLLGIHIFPLHNYILQKTQFGKYVKQINNDAFIQKSFKLLKKFQKLLLVIYENYFSKQNASTIRNADDQFKILLKLGRQLFQSSKMLPKSVNYLMFLYLIHQESQSVFNETFKTSNGLYQFGFQRFLEYIIILSRMITSDSSFSLKVILHLLEVIEISDFYQKICSQKNIKDTFFISEAELANLEESRPPPRQDSYQFIIKDYEQTLKLKFIKLCSKRFVQTNFYMDNFTAAKLIQNVCPKIQINSIDIILASVGRLNFQNFIKLLKILSQKTARTLESIFDQVLLYNSGEFNISLIFQNMRIEKQEYQKCKEIIKTVNHYLKKIFDAYSTLGLLSFQKFKKLFQELQVTPALVRHIQLPDIFDQCSSSIKKQKMTFEQFKNSLLLITLSVQFDKNIEGAQKMVYLLQKMAQSHKSEYLSTKQRNISKQDPLYLIKIKFSEVYGMLEQKLKGRSQIKLRKNQFLLA